jgi:hypothetical protein
MNINTIKGKGLTDSISPYTALKMGAGATSGYGFPQEFVATSIGSGLYNEISGTEAAGLGFKPELILR